MVYLQMVYSGHFNKFGIWFSDIILVYHLPKIVFTSYLPWVWPENNFLQICCYCYRLLGAKSSLLNIWYHMPISFSEERKWLSATLSPKKKKNKTLNKKVGNTYLWISDWHAWHTHEFVESLRSTKRLCNIFAEMQVLSIPLYVQEPRG